MRNICSDAIPQDIISSVPRVDAIRTSELKSFIDECFVFTSPDNKLLPGYRRIVDRLYHAIADSGGSIGEMALQQVVSMTVETVDNVLKPEWHFLIANYMDIHSNHCADSDQCGENSLHTKAMQILLFVFPVRDSSVGLE